MKVSITEYNTNDFGEIIKNSVKVTFEELDIANYEHLIQFYKLLYPKRSVHVHYENKERCIAVIGKNSRQYIKIIK